jgi:hypothetical protein
MPLDLGKVLLPAGGDPRPLDRLDHLTMPPFIKGFYLLTPDS